ncbi:hypothetical protein [Cupriavidus pauculus]
MKDILYIAVIFALAACGQASNDNQTQANKDELVRKMVEANQKKSNNEIQQAMEDAQHPRGVKPIQWSKHEK